MGPISYYFHSNKLKMVDESSKNEKIAKLSTEVWSEHIQRQTSQSITMKTFLYEKHISCEIGEQNIIDESIFYQHTDQENERQTEMLELHHLLCT
jgi:hypothetical protein